MYTFELSKFNINKIDKKHKMNYLKEKTIENKIVGGAGIAPLKNSDKNICELQKMYFLPVARGKGLGSLMIKKCIDYASKSRFEYCYIETMHNMINAQKLYKKYGFEFIDSPLGNTGHSSCPVWMLKKL